MSVGNKADVSGNDLLQYWAEDPRTDVILLYLESFGNPRKFAEIARRVGPTQADRGGQGRALGRRRARRLVAHRRARDERRAGRRAVARGRRDPDRHARGAVRRRDAALAPAGAGRPPRGDGDQRRRPGDSGGRRLRGHGLSCRCSPRPRSARCALSCRRGQRGQPGRHDCLRNAGAVSSGRIRDGRRGSAGRQRHRDLHSAAGHRTRGGRRRDPRGRRRAPSRSSPSFMGRPGRRCRCSRRCRRFPSPSRPPSPSAPSRATANGGAGRSTKRAPMPEDAARLRARPRRARPRERRRLAHAVATATCSSRRPGFRRSPLAHRRTADEAVAAARTVGLSRASQGGGADHPPQDGRRRRAACRSARRAVRDAFAELSGRSRTGSRRSSSSRWQRAAPK